MSRYRQLLKIAACLSAICVLSAFSVTGSPGKVSLLQGKEPLSAGTYNGTFIFSLDHTYIAPGPSMPMNYFSLRAEEVMGTVRFNVNESGTVTSISIRIPGCKYDVVNSQTITVTEGSQGEYNCTGNNSYAAGFATASGGSGLRGAPPLKPISNDFYTKPIKINAGDPWGRVSLIGKCPANGDSQKFIDAVKADINSLPASEWFFTITWQGVTSANGTCTTYSWETAYRSITCNWAAYSGGYKRKTAPGAG